MKISLSWLKDYVVPGVSVEVLAQRLTMAGLEVEHIEAVAGDYVLEMEITPNRPDCLSVIGLARDISAVMNKPKKIPAIKNKKRPAKKCDVTILEKSECLRYIGTLIENIHIKNKASIISKRLTSLRMKPINNVVDVTNFCLMETGQPLHAFDYDKLEGGKIIVRKAKSGEKIVTLDGVERELDPSILVIADAKKPVAIAGIMGGMNSEVTAETKNILLESAYFNPTLIRRTSRKLALSSDSAYRFERGVPMDSVSYGSQRAVDLILQEAGGRVTRFSDVKNNKMSKKNISLSVSMETINGYLGSTLSVQKCSTILKKLDFKVAATKAGIFKLTPPAFRFDIKQPVDVIEEIARVIGYDHLPSSQPRVPITQIPALFSKQQKEKVKTILCGQGFNEVVTYAMTNKDLLQKSGQGDLEGIAIKNPLSQDQERMRPTMLPSLLQVVQTNVNRGQKNLKLFEAGKIYGHGEEKEVLALIMSGVRTEDWRELNKKNVDFFDLKGSIEHVLNGVSLKDVRFQKTDNKIFEDGAAAQILVNDFSTGFLGIVAKDVLTAFGIKQKDVIFAEIDLTRILKMKPEISVWKAISEFPGISRDISLAVKKEVSYQQIKDIIRKSAKNYLSEINFTEEYLGDKIPKGYRGLVFSLQYQSSQRTLREEDVSIVHSEICQALQDHLQVIIR